MSNTSRYLSSTARLVIQPCMGGGCYAQRNGLDGVRHHRASTGKMNTNKQLISDCTPVRLHKLCMRHVNVRHIRDRTSVVVCPHQTSMHGMRATHRSLYKISHHLKVCLCYLLEHVVRSLRSSKYTQKHTSTLLVPVVINMAPASLVCERGESEPDATGMDHRSSASFPSLSFGVKTHTTSTLPPTNVNFPSWQRTLHLAARYGSKRCRLYRLQDPVTGWRLCVHP